MDGATRDKRTYLVVIDDSSEARTALHFAARRAAKTNGGVEVLAVVEPQDFVQWGGVQAAIEEEQRLRIEATIASSVGEIMNAAGIEPTIVVRQGEPVPVVRAFIGEEHVFTPRLYTIVPVVAVAAMVMSPVLVPIGRWCMKVKRPEWKAIPEREAAE